jgi:alcohol dehydrogenase class IV
MAAEAVRLLVTERALERALSNGADLDARGACLIAANLAGQAVSTSMLGAVHAFAHALGAHKGIPHGVANGIFLVPVMEKNAEKARAPYAHLAAIVGKPDVAGAIREVERVVHEVAGIPTKLAALGVTDADVSVIAGLAATDPDLPTNPVMFEEADVERMIRARM